MWIGSNRRAEQAVELIDQLQQRDAAADREIHHLAGGVRRFERQQIAVNDVIDVGEVARLRAVAVDRRRFAGQHRRDELAG